MILISLLLASQITFQQKQVIFYGDETSPIPTDPTFGHYSSFPTGMIRKQNGDLLISYSRNLQHATTIGRIVHNISHNNGRTWGSKIEERIFSNDGTLEENDQTFKRLRNGDIASVYETDYLDGRLPQRHCWFIRSSNDGETWGTPVDMGQFGENPIYCSVGGGLEELDDGTLLMPIYYRNNGAPDYIVILIQSIDDGLTWTKRATVAKSPLNGLTLQFEEPQMHRHPAGYLMMLIRSDTNKTIYSTVSIDDGFSWSPLVFAFKGFGWPAWIPMQNGISVAATRGEVLPYRTQLNWSLDGGLTWSLLLEPDPADKTGMYLYSSFIELSANRIGFLNAAEGSPYAGYPMMFYTEMEIIAPEPPIVPWQHLESSLKIGVSQPSFFCYPGEANPLSGVSQASWSLWWRREYTEYGGQQLVMAQVNGSKGWDWRYEYPNLTMYLYKTSGYSRIVMSGIQSTMWQNILLTFDNGIMHGYINGTETSLTITGLPPSSLLTSSGATLCMFASASGGNWTRNLVYAQLGLYATVRNPTDEFNGGYPGSPTGSATFRMNNGKWTDMRGLFSTKDLVTGMSADWRVP